MRVFVTGARGQLGTELVGVCRAAADDVVASEVDITDRDAVHQAICGVQPDVVVNCAAWTAVDACESDPLRADLVNGLAVRWIAEACTRVDAHLVHLSTDYVFDGTLDRPYREDDPPSPLSTYGRSKWRGEREAAMLGTSSTIVRTSWVSGYHGANMVRTILDLAARSTSLSFVDDQVGHPTFTADLAPVLRRLAVDRLSGIVHVTNQGVCSWFEFARAVVASSGRDPDMVQPIGTRDLVPARPAPRPANSVLDNAVLRGAGHALLRHYREPLDELVAALRTTC
ncbi:MAG: dTDP-4-dehydrorhamnose reductase [Ilumatobacteraceae bacterium]